MFEPTCDICGDSYHGHDDEPPGDTHNHEAVLSWPSCEVCGRVVSEDDHREDAGSGAGVVWCSYEHSPDGIAEIVEFQRLAALDAERIRSDSQTQLQNMIDDAVRHALDQQGIP
jgi:hypothetical protein